ncbi:hypothetical protein Sros01_79670 [Streptomyces roseochromogenus]|nr:hypothetical protein Sros01_79670 [Streptomyces roseochromogenus]
MIGLGRIGSLVARRMAAFDMSVIAYDLYADAERAAAEGVELLPLADVLDRSDFLTVRLPKALETTGLLGREAFEQMKPGIRIVNAARGGIVRTGGRRP